MAGNDLALADGTVLGTAPAFDDLYGAYADDWRVGAFDTLFDYAAGGGPDTFARLRLPRGVVGLDDLTADVVAAATAAVDACDPVRRGNAILDVALSGDLDYARSALLADAATGGSPPLGTDPSDAPRLGGIPGVRALAAQIDEATAAGFGIAFSVWRTGDLADGETVTWTLGGDVAGSDLAAGQPRSGTITFAAGQAESVMIVAVRDDTLVERDEMASLAIASDDLLLAGPVSRTLILDDDTSGPRLAIGLEPAPPVLGGVTDTTTRVKLADIVVNGD